MSFEIIAMTILLIGWMACGVLPWLVLSVVTRADAGLAWLPLSMVVAVLSAMLVPILGATGVAGLWFSFVAAVAGPAALLAARRFSLGASRQVSRARSVDQAHSPESPE